MDYEKTNIWSLAYLIVYAALALLQMKRDKTDMNDFKAKLFHY